MAKKPKRRRWFIPVLLVAGLLVAAANVFPVRQLISLNRDVQAREVQLLEIQEENARLEREIEALHSPTEIERIARTDFGYVRPGEISYVVFSPEDPLAVAAPEPLEDQVPAPASGGFWEALWDYLTGRDLVDG
ncbi:MAG: septum formation initiator family protein [bacterium]|nr:septum formation initiator family protein [bacterium]